MIPTKITTEQLLSSFYNSEIVRYDCASKALKNKKPTMSTQDNKTTEDSRNKDKTVEMTSRTQARALVSNWAGTRKPQLEKSWLW